MKRFIVLLARISLFTLSTACATKPSVELVNASVDIVNDKDRVGAIGITEGEQKSRSSCQLHCTMNLQ